MPPLSPSNLVHHSKRKWSWTLWYTGGFLISSSGTMVLSIPCNVHGSTRLFPCAHFKAFGKVDGRNLEGCRASSRIITCGVPQCWCLFWFPTTTEPDNSILDTNAASKRFHHWASVGYQRALNKQRWCIKVLNFAVRDKRKRWFG